jgi:catechol 2,3-dioxygenase-like lactoylglutathione lyase family enzyme
MRPGAVLETALYVADLEAAEAFYGGVLGLPVAVRAGGRHVFFRLDHGMLLIFNPDATAAPPAPGGLPVPQHGAHGPAHVAFAATAGELDGWRARLEAADVAIEADFRWPGPDGAPGARSIYIRDPAGNSVEFAEPRLWGFER